MLSPFTTISSLEVKRGTRELMAALLWGIPKSGAKLILFFLAFIAVFMGLEIFQVLTSQGYVRVYANGSALSVGSFILFLVFVYGIWVVASGRKKVILYLRRFQDSGSNEAMTRSIYTSLRGIARLIVLDDGMFKAISLPIRERFLGIVTWVPFTFSMLLFIVFGQVYDGALSLTLRGGNLRTFGIVTIYRGNQPIEEGMTIIEGSLLTNMPIAILTWTLLIIMGVPLWRYILTSGEAHRAVTEVTDIDKLAKRVRYLKSWTAAPKVFGSMATIASTADRCWKDTVSRVAREADVIIIDISTPSEAIIWELEFCADNYPEKLLVTVNADKNFEFSPEISDLVARIERGVQRSALGGALFRDTQTIQSRKRFRFSLRCFLTSPNAVVDSQGASHEQGWLSGSSTEKRFTLVQLMGLWTSILGYFYGLAKPSPPPFDFVINEFALILVNVGILMFVTTTLLLLITGIRNKSRAAQQGAIGLATTILTIWSQSVWLVTLLAVGMTVFAILEKRKS